MAEIRQGKKEKKRRKRRKIEDRRNHRAKI